MDEQPTPEDQEEGEYHLVEGFGVAHAWRRLAYFFQLPAIAWPGEHTYRVLLQGSGFVLPLGSRSPAIGFLATRYVAARDQAQAEEIARELVLKEWFGIGGPGRGLPEPAAPYLQIEESNALRERFWLRKGGGFTYFTSRD